MLDQLSNIGRSQHDLKFWGCKIFRRMALLHSEKLKDINPSHIDLITGYFKQIQSQINDNYDPPSLVIYITILYYLSREYFSICGGNININEDGDTVSTAFGNGGTAFGNILITANPSAKYIWKFQIIDKQKWSTVTVGIALKTESKEILDRWFYKPSQDVPFYAYKTVLKSGYKFENDPDIQTGIMYGHGAVIGDMITMELDTKQKSIRFYLNEEDLGMAYENVKFDFEQDEIEGYHMAVFINRVITSVKLIDFDKVLL